MTEKPNTSTEAGASAAAGDHPAPDAGPAQARTPAQPAENGPASAQEQRRKRWAMRFAIASCVPVLATGALSIGRYVAREQALHAVERVAGGELSRNTIAAPATPSSPPAPAVPAPAEGTTAGGSGDVAGPGLPAPTAAPEALAAASTAAAAGAAEAVPRKTPARAVRAEKPEPATRQHRRTGHPASGKRKFVVDDTFKRCPPLGREGAVICRWHICNGAAGKEPACRPYLERRP